jgi:hypothetical protein
MKFQTPEEFWKETYDRWEKEKDPEHSGTSQSPLMTSVKLNISICKTLLRLALPPQLKGS